MRNTAAELNSGKVKLDKNNHLHIEDGPGSYDISPEGFNTYEKSFAWCSKLSEKGWMTPEMMSDVVYCFAEYLHQIKLPRPTLTL